jgi:Sulfotransferase family
MPNQDNIEAPVTLVSFGRSGTTVVSNVFEKHPEFSSVGETSNLIFGSWRAVEASAGTTPPSSQVNPGLSKEERISRTVHQVFLTFLPDERPRWFQKPIHVPEVLSSILEDENLWADAADWYWKVMRSVFPNAQYLTTLRHPCDVILSAKSFWGYGEVGLWRSMGFMAYLLTHPASPVQYAVHFESLFHAREETVRELFAYLEVPFYNEVLGAFSVVHVPSKGREKLDQGLATRRSEWERLDPAKVKLSYVRHIERLFEKFGYSIEWPTHFTENNLAGEQQDPKQTIKSLNWEINRLHSSHAAETQELWRQVLDLQAELDKTRPLKRVMSHRLKRLMSKLRLLPH